MASQPPNSIWRNLGAFFGNIAAGVAADPNRPPARLSDAPRPLPQPHPGPHPPHPAPPHGQVIGHTIQQARVMTPSGAVTLRRTVIDEVVPDGPAGESGASSPPEPRK